MSKSSRIARQRAQEAAAALRREQARRRRRLLIAGSAVGVVVVVLATLIIVRLAMGPTSSPPPAASGRASAEVVKAVTGVPASVLEQVGLGSVDTLPKAISGQPALTGDGKPLVLYVGAEYCPFCAAQRWGMVVALSRFGTFENLGDTHSASDDVFPNTATLSFHGMTYSSQYVVFQGVETQTNVRSGNSYTPLDTLTAQQQAVVTKYNAPPFVAGSAAGAIPFVDFGNKYVISGASVNPQLFAGLTSQQIAAALSDPNSPIAKAVNGSANAFTAAICDLTNNQPAAVCTSPAVTAYQAKLHAG